MTGAIPFELGNLSKLERLSIQYNQLTSSIPSRLSNLTELTSLRLNGNRLTGTIPLKLSSLNNLQILLLDNNELTGSIPSELGNLSELVVLRLHNNQLTGMIPPELGSPPNLDELFLSGNQLTGCIPITLSLVPVNDFAQLGLPFCDNPDRAVLVALYHATNGDNWNNNSNWLTGAPLSEWLGVTTDEDGRVAGLVLQYNALAGGMPSDISSLTNLVTLDVSGNRLTGEIPPTLGSLDDLETLKLNSNLFTGSVPEELARLSKLRTLSLGFNDLTGEIPPEFGELVNLEDLSLGDNRLSGTIPPELAALSKLKDLSLQYNELTGGVPSWTGEFGNLEALGLHVNNLTGEIPPELGNLSKLEFLGLRSNYLTGEIPTAVGNLTELEGLGLNGNNLTGEVPAEIGNLTKLEDLSLSNNRLTGMLPRSMIRLTLLEEFAFDHNAGLCAPADDLFQNWMQGISDLESRTCGVPPPPSHESDIAVLTDLYNATDGANWKRSGNWLTDVSLSEWYGVRTDTDGRVTRLYLGDNNLSGTLPAALGNMASLKSLSISNNQLAGQLPSELTQLAYLTLLYFDYNAGLCAPDDATFQEWMQSVNNVQGSTCIDTTPPDPVPTLPECVEALPDEMIVEGTWNTDCTSDVTAQRGSGDRYARFYTFTFDTESDVTITLSSDEDAFLYLRTGTSTDGATLHENDDYNYPASTDSRIEETLEAGTYTIEATTYVAGATGDFILTINGIGPLDDRDALVALYNAGGGDNWRNNTNWLTDAPLNEWYGVTTDEDGRATRLDLEENNLSGHIPPEIGNLVELTDLSFRGNRLTSTVPPELSRLNNLQVLPLNDNELTGSIPSELGSLTNLKELFLSRNQLTGTIPPELSNLPNLDKLFLSDNQFTGCIPFILREVPVNDFTRLDLPFCDNPDRAVLVALYHATNGDNWTNNTNWLTDTPLYKWHGVDTDNRWNVHELSLNDNQLTGQLPPELGEFYAVKGLYFDNNQLTSHIPPELGDLSKNLVALWLHSNQFAGTIPPELGNLDKLGDLDVSDNQFTGELPDELTKLRELYSLLFDDNAGLCAPTDAELQQWLQSIDDVEGTTCTDTTPTPTPTPEDPIPSECVSSLGGTPAEGTWTADCLSINRTENGVHYARYYFFTLDRRSQVDLTLESSTDPYLILLGESGEVLAEDDDDDDDIFDLSARDSGIRITLDPGDYIVEATTYAGAATGDFTLTFSRSEMAVLRSLNNADDDSEYLETCKV